jgi:potassium efflux system protein
MTRLSPAGMMKAAVLALMLLGPGGAALAQQAEPVAEGAQTTPEATAEATAETGAETTPEAAAAEIGVVALDLVAWEELAARAEGVVARGQGSAFALRRLRADLVDWRDLLLDAQSVNARRIDTVTAQIAALGPAPAEGAPSEAESVTARRAVLEAQLAELVAPVRLAEEAHARAGGLVGEIDLQLRARNRALLMERGTSPLAPEVWVDVAETASSRVIGLWKELKVSLTSDARRAVLFEMWPWGLFYLALGWALFMRGARAVESVAAALAREIPRGAPIWRFAASVLMAALPILGVSAFVAALETSGMFGYRMSRLLDALPMAALFYFGARWLARQLFGEAAPDGLPQEALPEDKAAAQRLVMAMGAILAMLAVCEVLVDTGDVAPEVRTAILMPFEIAIAVFLFRFGRALSTRRRAASDAATLAGSALLRRQVAYLAGRLIMLGSLAAPVLTLMGYGLAARAVLFPMVLTLALVALVILLQLLIAELWAFVTRDEAVKRNSLGPLVGGFVLALLAVPVGALIWGARVEDLAEVWTRFTEGYSVGDTRISPAVIATFLIVFGIGYTATRMVQGVLRASILPKTRLDIGAQNALVAGLGYVGIFLAAMVAISTTGLNLSNVAIVAGALSVGIGFGLQTIVSNFVSGIILLIERPISEGDWIEVGGRMGYVRDISVRATRIETFDRTDVIVPNADLVSGQVVNWTRGNLVGRVIIAVGVGYNADIDRVSGILREIAEAHPMVILSPPPAVVLVGFGADSLNFEIRAIIRDINFGLSVKSEMNAAIAKRFREEGIEIPFPQRDVWVRNPEDLRPDPRAWGLRGGMAEEGEA